MTTARYDRWSPSSPSRKLQVVSDVLIDNAVKFTPAGGTISLSLSADSVALIAVADTGVGIPLAEQDSVFERFRHA